MAQGFDNTYKAYSGDLKADGRTGLDIKSLTSASAPIVVDGTAFVVPMRALPKDFVLVQNADRTFTLNSELITRGFIADLCGIMNWANNPRADGYSSNGSDERRMAEEYYDRVGYPYIHHEP